MGVKIREKVPGSGEYWVFINHKGLRRSKKVGDLDTANDAAEKIRAKLLLGDFGILEKEKPTAPTFRKYAQQWLVMPNDDWKDSTRKSYRFNLENYVFPKIGKYPIDKIDRERLFNLLDGLLQEGKSPKSVQLIKTTISGVFTHAMERGTVKTNPARGIKIKGTRGKKGLSVEPLTPKEANLLLKAAKEYQRGRYYPIILCALRTGMRLGELQGLQWGDIDFNSRFIWVKRSWRKGQLSSTKNRNRRRVDMSPALAETLKALRLTQKKKALEKGMPVPEWVFANGNGNVFQRYNFRNAFSKCLTKAGLCQIRVHDLRHSYATIRLVHGHNIGDVCNQLGHSSISITYDVYGHWVPGSFKNEVDDLDSMHLNAPCPHPGKVEVVK